MAKLLASAEVQRLTKREREKLDELAEELRGELVLCGRQAVENIREIIEDPGHPQCVSVSKWVLDRIVPRLNDGAAVAVALQAPGIDPRVADQLVEGFRVMTEKFGSADRTAGCEKYLLRATEGLSVGDD
jgi:hypothetical protein